VPGSRSGGSLLAVSGAAPGRLEALQAFVNTHDLETGEDAIGDPAALVAWLRQAGWLAEDLDLGPDDVRRAAALREAIRSLGRVNDGDDPDPAAIRVIALEAERSPLAVSVDEEGRTSLRPLGAGIDGALGQALAVLAEAGADGTWTRMKSCRNDACGWFFYDRSRNRSRHWCAANPCGNLINARAYRSRQRGQG
jgi:predicted RNA-binding Zn ribbon-like protein